MVFWIDRRVLFHLYMARLGRTVAAYNETAYAAVASFREVKAGRNACARLVTPPHPPSLVLPACPHDVISAPAAQVSGLFIEVNGHSQPAERGT